ncbi:MAG: hypothetical protein U1E83_10340 [Methylotetracoccus sp.]
MTTGNGAAKPPEGSKKRRMAGRTATPRVGRNKGTNPADAPAESVEPGHEIEHTLESLSVDEDTAKRMQALPQDVGWLLVTAGAVGVVMPGVLGLPFLVLGGLILWPKTNRRAERWLEGHAPKLFQGSMRQISRFLDDLERRYPRSPKS